MNGWCLCDDCVKKCQTDLSLSDIPLGAPVRAFADTFSAETVVLRSLGFRDAPDPQLAIMRTANAPGRIVDDVRPDQRD
jgi:hypothetical protein